MTNSQYEINIMPARGYEVGDKPIDTTPIIWERIRTVARKHSADFDSTGVVSPADGVHLAKVLGQASKTGEFTDDVKPVVNRIVSLLTQRRGMIVQRRNGRARM